MLHSKPWRHRTRPLIAGRCQEWIPGPGRHYHHVRKWKSTHTLDYLHQYSIQPGQTTSDSSLYHLTARALGPVPGPSLYTYMRRPQARLWLGPVPGPSIHIEMG